MQKKVRLLLLLFAINCTSKQTSIGDINQLTIISSEEDRLEARHIIEYFFNQRYINTPQNEQIYPIVWSDLKDINNAKLKKNLLLLSLDYPLDSTIDVLVDKIKTNNHIENQISSLDDLFAKDQKTIILESINTIELEEKMNEHFKWFASEFNQNIYANYYQYIRSKGQNQDLESLLADKFKISLFIQEDYKLINEKENFMWIGRGYPYRWIIFCKLKKSELDKKINLYDLFDDILKDNNVGIDINNQYRQKTTLNYNNVDSYVYRGIYDHKDSQTGGPFALYLLGNIHSDEVILIASIINNPGNTKMPHLLQMDALIKNIKFIEERK